ncbi:MAG: hypothetical protein AAF182_03640, partial [Pseudomonadota bacterium]
LGLDEEDIDPDTFVDGLNQALSHFDRFGAEDDDEAPELSAEQEQKLEEMESTLREAFPDISEQNMSEEQKADIEKLKDKSLPEIQKGERDEPTLREKMQSEITLKISVIETYTDIKENEVFSVSEWSQDLGYVMGMNYAIAEIANELKKHEEAYGTQEMRAGEYQNFLRKVIDKISTIMSDQAMLEDLCDYVENLMPMPGGISTDVIDLDEFTIGVGEMIGFLETEHGNCYEVSDNIPEDYSDHTKDGFGFDFDPPSPN